MFFVVFVMYNCACILIFCCLFCKYCNLINNRTFLRYNECYVISYLLTLDMCVCFCRKVFNNKLYTTLKVVKQCVYKILGNIKFETTRVGCPVLQSTSNNTVLICLLIVVLRDISYLI